MATADDTASSAPGSQNRMLNSAIVATIIACSNGRLFLLKINPCISNPFWHTRRRWVLTSRNIGWLLLNVLSWSYPISTYGSCIHCFSTPCFHYPRVQKTPPFHVSTTLNGVPSTYPGSIRSVALTIWYQTVRHCGIDAQISSCFIFSPPYCTLCTVAYLDLFVHDSHVALSSRFVFRPWQEREAELALSLLHPNIVRCLGTLPAGCSNGNHGGAGRGGDVGFLIFEHIPRTLLDLIQGCPGGLSIPEVGASSLCPAGIYSCHRRF